MQYQPYSLHDLNDVERLYLSKGILSIMNNKKTQVNWIYQNLTKCKSIGPPDILVIS